MTEPASIRNISLVGHSSSGKTMLAESLLFATGAISRQSTVEEGHTVSDFDPDEIKRKTSLSTAVIPLYHKNHKINILDTPGYADFLGEVESALSVAETALVLVDAVAGTKIGTNRVVSMASGKNLSKIFFINRMDKENAKFDETFADITSLEQGITTVAAFIPIGFGPTLKGIVDLVGLKAYEYTGKDVKEIPIPEDLQSKVDQDREKIVDAAAENDDALLEKYLESGELEETEIIKGLKAGVQSGNINLVFCGSVATNVGSLTMLDYIIKLCPSPLIKTKLPTLADGEEANVDISPNDPFSATVFKTLSDPYVGKLSFIRIFSGSLKKDQHILNAKNRAKLRIAHIYEINGKEHKDVPELVDGDIGAVPKLEKTDTTDTLATDKNLVSYDVIHMPESVLSFAIDPKNKEDDEKLASSLRKLAVEDPTLKIRRDAQTKETVISGMGDMHLEIVSDKLKDRYHVEAIMHEPKIPYRETIRGSAKAQGKHKKQSGGRGQYGDVWLRLETLERGKQFEFLNEIKGGVVPSSYIPAVEKSVIETMEAGVIAGYPIVDVKVALYDGSYHPVDSSEMAFKIAASMAFKKAFTEENPVLLEPMMNIEVHVPEKFIGDVIANLSSKRGHVVGTEAGAKYHSVKAVVPLAEIAKYAIELRSIAHGEGDFVMVFSHYEEMPPDLSQKVIAKSGQQNENQH